jgi:hypothetical protein
VPSNRARALPLLLIVGVVALFGDLVIAAPAIAKTPGRAPTDVTCGMVITTPGTYLVSGTLNCNGDGIDVNTSDVTIQFTNDGYLMCSGCPQSGGTATGISVYDPAGGPLSNVNILGPGTIDSYPFGVSFAGVKDSQVSAIFFNFGGLDISLNDDASGDHSQNDVFTNNTTYFPSVGAIVGTIYSSTFIGNALGGGIVGAVGIGIQILNGNKNRLTGNSSAAFTVGIELGGAGSSGASGNILTGNHVYANTTGLLVMPPADGNRIELNYFSNVLDIDEGNPSCGTDVYIRNIFATSNQSCV